MTLRELTMQALGCQYSGRFCYLCWYL